jgi:branched-chain amino acid transport system substrate-binding protein
MNKVRSKALALVVLASVTSASCGRDSGSSTTAPGDGGGSEAAVAASPGITEDTVVIGTSTPLSGPTSFLGVSGRAMKAYFDHVNDTEGGITFGDGVTRKVRLELLDDAYDPARTVANVRQLVERDEVFAVVGSFGTAPNAAVMDYLNDREVPQLFAISGSTQFGASPSEHPWTMGFNPPYTAEAKAFADHLLANRPDAKVAILFQNDDLGADYLEGFEQAIEGSDIEIVARESYEVTDPTVDSQVTNLASSGADVFFNVSSGRSAGQAMKKVGELGWTPVKYIATPGNSIVVLALGGLENARDAYSVTFMKNGYDPQWDGDEAVEEFKSVAGGAGLDPKDAFVVLGYTVGVTTRAVLERTEEPTRAAVMEAARDLDGVELPMLLPGMTLSTSADDGFPVESVQIMQFDGVGSWQRLGDLISFEGGVVE